MPKKRLIDRGLSTFDPEGSGYDYDTALANDMQPNPIDKHWQSRVASGVDEGQILKGRGHKTFHLTEEGEDKAGYEIFKSPASGGKYYSRQRRGRGM